MSVRYISKNQKIIKIERITGMKRTGEAGKLSKNKFDLLQNCIFFGEGGIKKRRGLKLLASFSYGTAGGITNLKCLQLQDGTKKFLAGYENTLASYDLVAETKASVASLTAVFLQDFDVSAQDNRPYGVCFNNDGSKMYVSGSQNDKIYEYNLSTPYDTSTAVFLQDFSTYAQDTAQRGFCFNNDGSKMYIVGNQYKGVYEYDLSTPYDISTAVFSSQGLTVSAQDTSPSGVCFNNDGSKMYVSGNQHKKIYEYNLSTPYDTSTAVFLQDFDISAQDNYPSGVCFNNDGSKMYVVGRLNEKVYEYDLSTPYDISTAVFLQDFDVSAQDNRPYGVCFNNDGSKMYVAGNQHDKIYEYNLSNSFTFSSPFSSKTDFGIIQYQNYLYISNGKDGKLRTWNGTALLEITDTRKGRILLSHAGRIWLSGDDDSPFSVFYSKIHGLHAGMVTSDPPFSASGDWTVGEGVSEGEEILENSVCTGLVKLGENVVILMKNNISGYGLLQVDVGGTMTKVNSLSFEEKGVGNLSYAGVIGGGGGVFFVNERGVNIISEISGKIVKTKVVSEDLKEYIEGLRFDKSASIYYGFMGLTLIACREKDVENNNIVLVHSEENNAWSIFRGWQIGAWEIIDNNLYCGSSIEPKIYQCFTGFDDEGMDISFKAKTFFNNFGEIFRKKKISNLFIDVSGVMNTEFEINTFLNDSKIKSTTKTISIDKKEISRNALGVGSAGFASVGGTDYEKDLTRIRQKVVQTFPPVDNISFEIKEKSKNPFRLHSLENKATETRL